MANNFKEQLDFAKKANELTKQRMETEKSIDSTLEDRTKILDDIASNQKDMSKLSNIQKGITSKINNLNKAGHTEIAKKYKTEQAIVANKVKEMKLQKTANTLLHGADKLTGGMASKAGGFMKHAKKMGPAFIAVGAAAGLIVGTFKLITKAVRFVSAMTDALGQSFGVVGARSDEFKNNMQDASVDVISLGKGTADVVALTGNLADNFGIGLLEASRLNDKILDSGVAMGLSTAEAGNLFGTLMSVGQLTADQAEHLAESTYQLAVANNVNPAAVMRDMADSSEMIAKFGAQNVKEITKAAVQARKLGLSLKTVDKISNSLLDFQSSIQSEMEASVMIGRQLNLNEARRLFNAGKTGKAMEKVLKQLGGEQKFNKLSILQRKSLAKAIGVEATELAKLVRNQGKSIEAQKTFNDLLGEDGMSALTSMIGKIKEIGANLLLNLGGPLEKLFERVEDVLLDPKTMETLNSMFDGLGANLSKSLAVLDGEYLEKKLQPFKDALVGADGTGGIAGSLSSLAASIGNIGAGFATFGRVVAGATAGATAGAAVGSIFPGLGTALGAAAGGIIGGIASLMFGGSGGSDTTTSKTVNDFSSAGGSHLVLTPNGQMLKTNPRDTVFGTTSVNDFSSGPAGSMGMASKETNGLLKKLIEQNEIIIRETKNTPDRMVQGIGAL